MDIVCPKQGPRPTLDKWWQILEKYLKYSSDVTLHLWAVCSRVWVFNSQACYWAIDEQ